MRRFPTQAFIFQRYFPTRSAKTSFWPSTRLFFYLSLYFSPPNYRVSRKSRPFFKIEKIWILSANNKRYMDKKYRSLHNYRVLEIYIGILQDSFVWTCVYGFLCIVSSRDQRKSVFLGDTVRVYTLMPTQKPSCYLLRVILAVDFWVQKIFLTFKSGNIFRTPCIYLFVHAVLSSDSKDFAFIKAKSLNATFRQSFQSDILSVFLLLDTRESIIREKWR